MSTSVEQDVERAAYSPSQVARLLGIGERQCRQFIAEGRIYSFRVGRRVCVPRRAVDALLSGHAPSEGAGRELCSAG